MSRKPARVPGTTKERMRASRALTCIAPSGHEVTIRPLNIEHHALSGGLPARLRAIAEGGAEAVDEALHAREEAVDPELLQYLDGLVARVFVEPAFEPAVYELQQDEDSGEQRLVQVAGDVLDEYLLPADYKWALLIGVGEEDEDGEGNRLWGRERLSRLAPFPAQRGGDADREGSP